MDLLRSAAVRDFFSAPGRLVTVGASKANGAAPVSLAGAPADSSGQGSGNAPTAEERWIATFEEMGGAGSLKIYRHRAVGVGGGPDYSATIALSEELRNNLDETIAHVVGGGSYTIKAFLGGRYVRGWPFGVDEKVFPPVETAAEKKRRNDPEGSGDPIDAAERIGALVQRGKDSAEPGMMEFLLAQSQAASNRELKLMELMLANRAPAPAPGIASGGLGELAQAFDLFQSMSGNGSNAKMGERLLERFADKLGDKLAPVLVKPIERELDPEASAEASAPAEKKEAASAPAPAAGEKMIPLSAEQLATIRRGRKLAEPKG